MIKVPAGVDVLNPDLVICNLDKKTSIRMEFNVAVGRGYRPAELNKDKKQPIGVIAIDSLFSPVSKVRYKVEAARVGMKTDYDRLVLEVWTDGRINPVAATVQSAELLLDHVQLFSDIGDAEYLEDWHEEDEPQEVNNDIVLDDDVNVEFESIESLNISKRTLNTLSAAGIDTVGKLAKKTETQLLELKNFGAKAVTEILAALKDKNLTLKAEPATDKQIAEMMKKSAKSKKK
jgi:DNA-directed RNA polymerase subunit alpha